MLIATTRFESAGPDDLKHQQANSQKQYGQADDGSDFLEGHQSQRFGKRAVRLVQQIDGGPVTRRTAASVAGSLWLQFFRRRFDCVAHGLRLRRDCT